MYELVANVGDYRLFVPWCRRSAVLSRRGHVLRAELEVGFPPLHERYLSEVSLGPRQIRVSRGVPPLLGLGFVSECWGSAGSMWGGKAGGRGHRGRGAAMHPGSGDPKLLLCKESRPQQRSPCPKTAPAAPCPVPCLALGDGAGAVPAALPGAGCAVPGPPAAFFALPQAVSSDCRLFRHLETLWSFGPGLPGRTDSCSLDFSVSLQHRGPGQALGAGGCRPRCVPPEPSPAPPRLLPGLLRVPLGAALPPGRALPGRGGQADGGRLRGPGAGALRAAGCTASSAPGLSSASPCPQPC